MKTLTHKFVETLPEPLDDGIIYVSIRFRIVAHNCCCGCGEPVILNLAPNGWKLTYDGKSISLHPSVGNWSLQCRSHYWITRNTVEWAESWSDIKVQRAQIREQAELNADSKSREGFWPKLRRKFRK